MSRSKKGSKGPGYEHWTRRGPADKKTTTRTERQEAKVEVKFFAKAPEEQSEPGRQIDLDDPKDARKFLRGVKIKGRHITYVKVESGKTLDIEEMDESQVVFYAKEVYFDFCGGVENEGGFIELEGVDQ